MRPAGQNVAQDIILWGPSKDQVPLSEFGLRYIEIAAGIACIDFFWRSASSRAELKAMH